MPAGRPSSYKPVYCNELIECLSNGHSMTAFAGSIGFGRSTVFEWLDKYPEFAKAYEVAKAKAVLAWEKTLIQFAKDGKGNAAAIIFALKNRSSEDWSEKVINEHMGKDGAAIAHSVEVTFVEAKGNE